MSKKRYISQGMINTFNWCEMKYFFYYVERIVSAYFHFPFVVGGATHEGVQHLLKKKNYKIARKKLLKYMELQKSNYEKIRTMNINDDREFQYQLANVEGMLKYYNDFYKDTLIKDCKMLFIERVIYSKIELPGNFILMVKIDGIMLYKNDKFIYELKSTKSATYNGIMAAFPQALTYYIVAKEKYKLKGIYINGIEKPQIKIKKNESIKDFIKRLGEKYSSNSFFDEIIIPSKRQVDQHILFIKDTIKRIIQAEKTGEYRCNRFMCRIYGVCVYLPICDYGRTPNVMNRYIKRPKYITKS